jgi:hypothetical protein
MARIGLAACHLEIAEFRKARTEARVAIADGFYRRAFEYIIAKADSALVATDSLDGANRWKPVKSTTPATPARRTAARTVGKTR